MLEIQDDYTEKSLERTIKFLSLNSLNLKFSFDVKYILSPTIPCSLSSKESYSSLLKCNAHVKITYDNKCSFAMASTALFHLTNGDDVSDKVVCYGDMIGVAI